MRRHRAREGGVAGTHQRDPGAPSVAREYEPVVGQWYESIDDSESFRVLSVDEDAELVEIEYLDGDIEEMDLDTWQELDLEKIDTPEGWSGDDDDDDEEGEEEEEEEEEDEDDDWDEDEDDDEDDDWDEDEDTDENY
jgi:hypothetical protein